MPKIIFILFSFLLLVSCTLEPSTSQLPTWNNSLSGILQKKIIQETSIRTSSGGYDRYYIPYMIFGTGTNWDIEIQTQISFWDLYPLADFLSPDQWYTSQQAPFLYEQIWKLSKSSWWSGTYESTLPKDAFLTLINDRTKLQKLFTQKIGVESMTTTIRVKNKGDIVSSLQTSGIGGLTPWSFFTLQYPLLISGFGFPASEGFWAQNIYNPLLLTQPYVFADIAYFMGFPWKKQDFQPLVSESVLSVQDALTDPYKLHAMHILLLQPKEFTFVEWKSMDIRPFMSQYTLSFPFLPGKKIQSIQLSQEGGNTQDIPVQLSPESDENNILQCRTDHICELNLENKFIQNTTAIHIQFY